MSDAQSFGYNGRRVPSAQRTLRAIRLEHGLSIRDLEKASGVDKAIISQLERGRLIATGDTLARLGATLEVELEWKPMVVEVST